MKPTGRSQDSKPNDVKKRSFLSRLFSLEVLGGALAGAGLPYLVAFVIQIAPTRVPLGLVVLSVGGGALLGSILLLAVNAHRRKMQAAEEQRDRERQEITAEITAELERLEQAIASAPPARKAWTKWRPPSSRR